MSKIFKSFLFAAVLNLLVWFAGSFLMPVFNALYAPALPEDAIIPLAAMLPAKQGDRKINFLWCGRPAPPALLHVCLALHVEFTYQKNTEELDEKIPAGNYDMIVVRELPPLSRISGNQAFLKRWENLLAPGGRLIMPEKLLRTLLPSGEERNCVRLPGDDGGEYVLLETSQSQLPDLTARGYEKRFTALLHRLNMDGSTLPGGYGAVYPGESTVFKVSGGNGTAARLTWKFFAAFWIGLACIWSFFRFFTAFRKRLAELWEAGETMAISCVLLFWPFYFKVPSAWCFNFAAALLLYGGVGGEGKRKAAIRLGSIILAISIVPVWAVLAGIGLKYISGIYLFVPSFATCLLFYGFGSLRCKWYGNCSSKTKLAAAEIAGAAAGIMLWSAIYLTMLFW